MFLAKLAFVYLLGVVTTCIFWYAVSVDSDVYSEEEIEDVSLRS